mmetsp:Transcript_43200/g.119494  ORF Transcript_43200/g.119494 Transcript_43200/m.119494 type:complete len:297 (+) Transcript_43200:99-989(+)
MAATPGGTQTPYFSERRVLLEEVFSAATDAVCTAQAQDVLGFLAKFFTNLAAAQGQQQPELSATGPVQSRVTLGEAGSPIVVTPPGAFPRAEAQVAAPEQSAAADTRPQSAAAAQTSALACHLVFDEANHGTFLLQWAEGNVATCVPGSLAAFVPRRSVPQHKVRSGGRSELCRDVGGVNRKKFYQGWVSFIKAADAMESTLYFLANLQTRPVGIHFNDDRMSVGHLQVGGELDFDGLRAIAVVHALSADFDVQIMQTRIFKQTGERVGAALSFDGGDGLPRTERAATPTRARVGQ